MKSVMKRLLRIAKKVVKREIFKKIKKVEDEEEKIKAMKYSIICALEEEEHRINKKIKRLENDSKDVFFIKNKAILIPSKIKHFKVDFENEDFSKLKKIIKEVNKEIENV